MCILPVRSRGIPCRWAVGIMQGANRPARASPSGGWRWGKEHQPSHPGTAGEMHRLRHEDNAVRVCRWPAAERARHTLGARQVRTTGSFCTCWNPGNTDLGSQDDMQVVWTALTSHKEAMVAEGSTLG